MKFDQNVDSKPTVMIYCKKWCQYLSKLVNLLQEQQISFTFIDLEYDAEAAQKLLSELDSPLILPIVVVNGTYYEKPQFSKLTELLVMNQWREEVDRKTCGKKSPEVP